MLSRTPILPLALLGILASAGWVKAANAMELAEAYRRAQQHDARIAAARAAHSAGREQLPQARARLLPTVTFEAGKTSYDANVTYQGNTTFQGGDRRYENREYGISLTQPLYQRSLFAAYRQSESRVALAEAEFQLAQHDLILRVTQVYLEMLAAQDSHRLVLSQQSTYQTQFDQAQARLKAGAGTRIEVSETRSRLDITISQEIAARNEVDVRRQTLWKLTGQQVSQLPEMGRQQTPKPPDPAQVEKWLALAEEKNPRLNALRHAVNAAEQEIQVARGAHHPTLDLNAGVANSRSTGSMELVSMISEPVRLLFMAISKIFFSLFSYNSFSIRRMLLSSYSNFSFSPAEKIFSPSFFISSSACFSRK